MTRARMRDVWAVLVEVLAAVALIGCAAVGWTVLP